MAPALRSKDELSTTELQARAAREKKTRAAWRMLAISQVDSPVRTPVAR
jgi:hypothetical protein